MEEENVDDGGKEEEVRKETYEVDQKDEEIIEVDEVELHNEVIQLLQVLNINMAFYSQGRHSPYLIKQ